MNKRVFCYVLIVLAGALVSVARLVDAAPILDAASLRAAACFVALGVLAQVSGYRAATSTSGSISFLPFLTAAALSPTWPAALAVSASVALAETVRRAPLLKAVFNVAQYTFAVSLAIIVYLALGGTSLQQNETFQLVPYCALVVVFLAVNTTAVSGVIAVSEGASVWSVWRQNTRQTLPYDIISFPVVYCFALIYNKIGIPGVVLLAVLLLGARQLYSTNRQLEKTNRDLLEVLVAAIEARDPYTSGHSRRVSYYSQVIARALGMNAREVERVGIAALLHDVGKIHEIFAPILQKPGKLTPEERATIELHPIKSEELVSMVSQLSHAVAAVRHHHENWDGTGYPDRIAGESIPLTSRIIMLADTIDAMTTDRPYRRALGPVEVRAELIKYRGTQFDPKICDVLLASAQFALLFDFRQDTPLKTMPIPRESVAA
jgi:HD-GYP domain-containing protein (c-di-GMP phosphodiesterase class II)